MTWDEAKINSDKLINSIESLLDKKTPKNISDVLSAVKDIDSNCGAIGNINDKGQYCQLILYPSRKWHTWGITSMSISKYNLFI